MLQEISKILDLSFDDSNEKLLNYLRRIAEKLPLNVETIDFRNKDFARQVIRSVVEVYKEGPKISPPPKLDGEEEVEGPKVYKIKRVKKGPRLKTVAPNGIRYSFGPAWNASVCSGEGLVLMPQYRPKLEYQASLAGLTGYETMATKELAELVAGTLDLYAEQDEEKCDMLE